MTNKPGEDCIEVLEDELTPKEKLLNLRDYLPGEEKIVYEFGAFLATRIDDSLVPEGFNLCAKLAIYDLTQGVCGFTNEEIQGSIAGYPKFIYSMMLPSAIGKIAKAVYSEEFAGDVEVVRDKIAASLESNA